ncbi:Fe-S cluster assembly protein SufD [uncultured Amnibacterium sp.]|uniref:Fe-S cluster assembly protein SufD n=1 Tax=uncultured Amnibacterium sp. TaxID=1631851 RepID=UPI0035CA6B94
MKETETLATPDGRTAEVVTGTGTRPGIIADATTSHGTQPIQTRNERFSSTDVTAFPKVTGREAVWKLTPIADLKSLIDGRLTGDGLEWSAAIDGAEPGSVVSFVGRDDPRIGLAGIPEDRAAANAWSSFERAMVLRIDGDTPVHVQLDRNVSAEPTALHTIVDVAPNASAVIVLRNTGYADLAENIEILVGDNAQLTFVSVQEWDDDSHHVASHFATVGRDARLKHVVVSLGGGIVRVNPSVTLAGPGADGDLLGLYFADAGQHLEQQVFLFHKGDHTRGRVNYRGALQGDGAHTVWIGDVLIGPDATGTDSYEQNRNLVLTEGTRADSVPNLEIETGDIAGAGHASATGRFDDEQLFYLQARGIPESQARRLVVRGFLAAIVQQIGVPELEARLHEAIEAELAGDGSTR